MKRLLLVTSTKIFAAVSSTKGWFVLGVLIWTSLSSAILGDFGDGFLARMFLLWIPFVATLYFFGRLMFMMRASTIALIGLSLVGIWIVIAIIAPVLPLADPNAPLQTFLKPFSYGEDGSFYLLGTDHKGRDLLSRVLWGCQRVLVWGFTATFIAYLFGIICGLVAGYKAGWWDEAMSFIVNVLLSFPAMILFILILIWLGTSGWNIVLAVSIASSPAIMRIVRGLVLDIKAREHVQAARVRGEPLWYVLFIEILPNIHAPLIVDACLRLGYTTVAITTLTFLGLGLQPPDPDWGLMIKETRNVALTPGFSYMILVPAISVTSLVLGLNLLADGWREWKQLSE